MGRNHFPAVNYQTDILTFVDDFLYVLQFSLLLPSTASVVIRFVPVFFFTFPVRLLLIWLISKGMVHDLTTLITIMYSSLAVLVKP